MENKLVWGIDTDWNYKNKVSEEDGDWIERLLEDGVVMRSEKEIAEAEEMFADIKGFGVQTALIMDPSFKKESEKDQQIMLEAWHRVYNKYKNNAFFKEFCLRDDGEEDKEDRWLELCGILETLRWVLGCEWGNGDT